MPPTTPPVSSGSRSLERVGSPTAVTSLLYQAGGALILLTVYTYFVQLPGWNELSRLDLTAALWRDHTTSIDAYHANTGDKADYGGHVYSDKAPGLSLLALPGYALLDWLEGFPHFDDVKADFRAYVASAFAVALPSVALALLFYRFVSRANPGHPARAVCVTAAYALGSLALPFSTMLFSHQASAALCFACFYFAYSAAGRKARQSWYFLGAGLLGGLAVLLEYPNGLALAAIVAYAWARAHRRAWPLAAGLVPGALVLLGYNAVTFASPFRLGYQFVSAQTFGRAHSGFFGLTVPSPTALLEILAGSRGLLTLAPWLALAPLGWWALRRRPELRAERWLLAAVPLLFLAYNSTYYQPLGGWSPGPRFMVPALPFAAALVAFIPAPLNPLFAILASWSFAAMALATAVDATPNDHIANVLGHWLERVRSERVAANQGSLRYSLGGHWSLLPLGALLATGAALVGAALPLARRQPTALRAAAWLALALGLAGYLALGGPVSWARPGEVPRDYLQATSLEASIQRLVHVRYGDEVELVGYDLSSRLLRPGDRAEVRLYWKALKPLSREYTVFVHLVGRDGETVAGIDRRPVDDTYPSSLWPPGRIVQDPYRLRLAGDAVAPALLRLEVGLYQAPGVQRLPASDAQGRPLGEAPPVALAELRPVSDPIPPVETARPARFGDAIELLGLSGGDPPEAGGEISGSTFWRALRPLNDGYTVFVQLLDAGGQVAAQWDSQPQGGQYPTFLWPPGQTVADPFRLQPQKPLAPGHYTLIVGLYLSPSGQRLRAPEGDHVVLREVVVA